MARISSIERKERKLMRWAECALIGHTYKPKLKGSSTRSSVRMEGGYDRYVYEYFCANCRQWFERGENWKLPPTSGWPSQPYLTAKLRAVAQPQFRFNQFQDVAAALPSQTGTTITYDRAKSNTTD